MAMCECTCESDQRVYRGIRYRTIQIDTIEKYILRNTQNPRQSFEKCEWKKIYNPDQLDDKTKSRT